MAEPRVRLTTLTDAWTFSLTAVGGAAHRTSFLDVSDDDWRHMWEFNFLTMVRATRAAVPLMVAQGAARS